MSLCVGLYVCMSVCLSDCLIVILSIYASVVVVRVLNNYARLSHPHSTCHLVLRQSSPLRLLIRHSIVE